MRILFISPRQCWPPVSGGKLRDFHLARGLGEHSDLTYAYFADPGDAPLTRSNMPFCRELISVPKPPAYTPLMVLRGLVGRRPLPILNYTSEGMVAALLGAVRSQRYDLIHLDSIQMAGCLEPLAEELGPDARVVYDWHNIESAAMRSYSTAVRSPVRRYYAALTAGKLERWEHSALMTGFGHVVCSEQEQQQLLKLVPSARISVIDNGVDTTYFSEGAAGSEKNRILFVGSMNYHPNIEAALAFTRELWPALRKHMPGYKLTIVGANPDPAVIALRELDGVEVTGTVPDVRPYYREALAAIVPLRSGGGTRLKILEAMAAGVPVISSELGAQGLHVEPGKNILLAGPDDGERWLHELLTLARSESRQRELTTAARQLVLERYDWTMLGGSLYETYRRWIEKTG